MKNSTVKAHLIISTAAATRLFLKIASLGVAVSTKGKLMALLSAVISGHQNFDDARFQDFGRDGEEISSLLAKAISRSAKARAAAARRRAAKAGADNQPPAPISTPEASPSSIKVSSPEKDRPAGKSRIRIANKNVRIKRISRKMSRPKARRSLTG